MNFSRTSLRSRGLQVFASLALACVLSACAGPKAALPPSDGVSQAEGSAALLQSGDEVEIQVFREPELSGLFRIGPDGKIRHSLLGDVGMEGLSPAQAERRITDLLAEKYLVNPRVILKAQSLRSSQVLIMGEVLKPGPYPLLPGERTTLLEAIAKAGGFSTLASPNRVRIVREVEGRRTTIKVRVADVLEGKSRHPDVPLEPNDVIVVPQIRF